jgi:hypothetical protein
MNASGVRGIVYFALSPLTQRGQVLTLSAARRRNSMKALPWRGGGITLTGLVLFKSFNLFGCRMAEVFSFSIFHPVASRGKDCYRSMTYPAY